MVGNIYEVSLTGGETLVVEVARTGIVTVKVGSRKRSFALPAFARVIRLNPEAVEVSVGELNGDEGMFLELPDGTVWFASSSDLSLKQVNAADTVRASNQSEELAVALAASAQPEPERQPDEPAETQSEQVQSNGKTKRYLRVKEILMQKLSGKLSEDEIRAILNELDTYRPRREKTPEDELARLLRRLFGKSPVIGEIKVSNHTIKLTDTVELYVDGKLICRVPKVK